MRTMPQLLQPHCHLQLQYSDQPQQHPSSSSQRNGGPASTAESSSTSQIEHESSVRRCVALEVCCKPTGGEGEATGNGISLLLDGRRFEACHRLRVRPLDGPDGDPLHLPVQCFASLSR